MEEVWADILELEIMDLEPHMMLVMVIAVVAAVDVIMVLYLLLLMEMKLMLIIVIIVAEMAEMDLLGLMFFINTNYKVKFTGSKWSFSQRL